MEESLQKSVGKKLNTLEMSQEHAFFFPQRLVAKGSTYNFAESL